MSDSDSQSHSNEYEVPSSPDVAVDGSVAGDETDGVDNKFSAKKESTSWTWRVQKWMAVTFGLSKAAVKYILYFGAVVLIAAFVLSLVAAHTPIVFF